MSAPTLFRFGVDYTEWCDGTHYPAIRSIWANTAKEALAAFMRQHANKKGFISLDAIDPMPSDVKLDGEPESIHRLGLTARMCALSLLAEQAGCKTPAEMRAFVTELHEEPEAVSKRLIAEWRGEDTGVDLARALAVAAE